MVKLLIESQHPELLNTVTEHVHTTVPYVVASLLFLPFKNSLGTILPILGVGWTLNFEMFFYLLFGSALALRVRVATLLTPVMIVLSIVGLFYQPSWPAVTSLASPLLLDFLAGVLLGQAVVKGKAFNNKLFFVIGIAGIFVLLFHMTPSMEGSARVLYWGIPALCAVWGVVATEKRFGHLWPKWVLLIGDASYSLYLSHTLVMSVVLKVLLKSGVLKSGVPVRWSDLLIFCGCCLVACSAAAILTYRFVETKMTEVLRKRLLGERRSPAHGS